MQVANQHKEQDATRSKYDSITTRAALRSALDTGTGSARLHRKAVAHSDRETWAGSGNDNNSGCIFGESVKYLSKVARSKVDQDNSARWGTAGGRRQPRKPISRTTTRLINRDSNSVETKATTPGIYIYGLRPVPPCIPYSKTESPRGRLSELLCSSDTSAAAQLHTPEGSGESNAVHGGVGGSGGGGGGSGGGGSGVPAELFGSFSRGFRLRQAEERDNSVVSSRKCAARDLQSFFRRTSEQRRYICRWRLGEPRSREEEHRSLVNRQISDEGEMNSRCHDGDNWSDGAAAAAAAAAASSQGVNNNVISQCSADVVGPDQSPVDAPSLSKLRLYVIAAWTGGVIDAAIARITDPGEKNLGEKRRVQSSPDGPLRNARVVASEFMANVTEVCLVYAVLAHDLRLTSTAGEPETAAPPSAVMTRTEPNHDCARRPGTGHHPKSTEGRKDGEDTPVASRVSNASANSPRVHGGVAHIFFPAPPCSTSLVPPDSADHRSCTGIPSLLKQGGTCSSALFSRLDRGEAEDVDDRPALAASSVLTSGNLINAMENGAATDMLMRRIYDNAREKSRKQDKNKNFAPIDTPIDNKPRAIPKYRPTVQYCGAAKSAVHSCGTPNQLETQARETCTCTRGGSPGRAQAAVEVGFAGVGTRPAEAVPRSSVTARWTRKGGGFLFRKRPCPLRSDYTGGGCGGGSSADSGGEESMVSLLSAFAIGHGESAKTTSPSFTTGLPRGEPVDSSGVEVGLDSGATVGRKAVLQAHHRHGHHVASDSPPKGAGAGGNFDTGIAHTIYGVAIGGSPGATDSRPPTLAEKSKEESPAVFRYRVPVSDQHALTSGPGHGKVFSVTDEETGAGAGAGHGTGGDGSAATESTGGRAEGRVSIRAAVDADETSSKLLWSSQPKAPCGTKARPLTSSPRKILYTGAAVSRPRNGGGSQASDSSSRRRHISTARGGENNHTRNRAGRDGKSLPATVVPDPSPRDRP